jgi:hypothetical protein
MEHPISEGLLYAGKAGGDRREAAPSAATLWGRISGNHLRGNVRSSTFRKSLAAVLGAAGVSNSEDQLTAWMHAHLRVHPLPVPAADVARLEDELVSRARPPLNLAGLPRDESRSTLSRLRGLLSGGPRSSEPAPPTQPSPADADDAARSFDARLRADLDAILRAGYRPTTFQRMLSEHGAVETAKRLLGSPQVSDGFRWLWEHRLLRLSVENAVLAPGFEELFTDHERAVAEKRLRDAGFRVTDPGR